MTVAATVAPVVEALFGDTGRLPVEVAFWDGSSLGPHGSGGRFVVRSQRALRRLLYAPDELGLGRAYVTGELEVQGDIFDALRLRDAVAAPTAHADIGLDWRGWVDLVRAAFHLRAVGPPLPPPPEEVRLRGGKHSLRRDRAAVTHHYDVGNDFYRLVLGPSMAYSCAYFPCEDAGLEEAQVAKFDLVARKLGLREGVRVLDVGCGWGGFVLRAAERYGATAVGITLSEEQATLARQRAADAGLSDRVEIRVQDYRELDDDASFDAIASIGMFEHVGEAQMYEYLDRLASLLVPHGRLLNHAISRANGPPALDRSSFVSRYVFPDGELLEVGRVVTTMHAVGLEVRDVHSLREHYPLTLRHWVANLEANWDEAVRLVGAPRARIWRLYLAGSALNFEANRTSVHQVLAVKPDVDGTAGELPLARAT